jgi:hypothetical protein
VGDSALDRLKRSNSFADAVEDVVMEYEKTIQALEASLSTTRTSMAGQESELLEREARISLLESQTHQLQSRIQKGLEREASNEDYVKSLSAKSITLSLALRGPTLPSLSYARSCKRLGRTNPAARSTSPPWKSVSLRTSKRSKS